MELEMGRGGAVGGRGGSFFAVSRPMEFWSVFQLRHRSLGQRAADHEGCYGFGGRKGRETLEGDAWDALLTWRGASFLEANLPGGGWPWGTGEG